MLDVFIENLDQHLSQRGVITNLILRTERSLYEDKETREIELYFAESETADALDQPLALIHLFPLDQQGTCEIEVELQFHEREETGRLWEEARKIVPEISLTEKRRYISFDRLVERSVVLDYHFVLSLPETEEEERVFAETWGRFADDLAALLRL
jgi:hypothetical protein